MFENKCLNHIHALKNGKQLNEEIFVFR